MNIARCIEKLQRDFVWIGLRDEFKYHLVKSKTICVPVKIGDWVFGIWFYLTSLCWGNDCGDGYGKECLVEKGN